MALYADWFLHAFVKKGEDAAAFSPFPFAFVSERLAAEDGEDVELAVVGDAVRVLERRDAALHRQAVEHALHAAAAVDAGADQNADLVE